MTDDVKKTNPPEGTDAPAERTDEGSPPAASVAEPGAETPKLSLIHI